MQQLKLMIASTALSKVEQAKWNTAWYNRIKHGCNCQTCIHANQLTASRLPKDVISIFDICLTRCWCFFTVLVSNNETTQCRCWFFCPSFKKILSSFHVFLILEFHCYVHLMCFYFLQ